MSIHSKQTMGGRYPCNVYTNELSIFRYTRHELGGASDDAAGDRERLSGKDC